MTSRDIVKHRLSDRGSAPTEENNPGNPSESNPEHIFFQIMFIVKILF